MAGLNVPDLLVDVFAKITIEDETAERCLRLLEMWQDDNPDKIIVCEKENGKTVFHIKKAEVNSCGS